MCAWVKWFQVLLGKDLKKEAAPIRLFVMVFIHSSRGRGHYTRVNAKQAAGTFDKVSSKGEQRYGKRTIAGSSENPMKKRLIPREETSTGTMSALLNMTNTSRWIR
ncbi:hypothetical protein [Mesobacillus foraminis]|uniref:hypothetical protein n=1 Tax=Mesobacillus foraminis TaxID=279826 RepID=UPI000EF546FF|nr:hypothetical protein [Mesobacillus foraminis]